ncbi:MAG: tRNA uridine(34) 5-carboxymethylaminomethyl modification radical SAM/GNAT enzyme Elp3 [Chloroflexi bacterium]|nr:tRNA uridine(34) 5-carboxymethylaminomethyl modification radical SAM/GNAT enzyme Elp3 [Chloroflexota bacterium]
MRKISRTLSGVTPVAVMTQPMGCPGKCIYCPNDPTVPRSYTTQSPAVLRGLRFGFDACRQVEARIKMFKTMGHATEKVELIVMGGTFLSTPVEYQRGFIKECYDALNQCESSSLEAAVTLNETAFHRCVGLCLETRPDWCGPSEVSRMLDFGVTRVELGVQTLDDDIYRLVKRGHGVAEVAGSTERLKEAGLKVHYHWMPGLPGSDTGLDLALFNKMFEDARFRPDGLKLYPTLVIQGTELEEWYNGGKYRPYGMDELSQLLVDMKTSVPGYVRISRLMRDMPVQFIVAGCRDLALREALKARMEAQGKQCLCIRCREFGHRTRQGKLVHEPHLRRTAYEASNGKEIFLSYEDENGTLFGMLRLRISAGLSTPRRALIRELHVFGQEMSLSEHGIEEGLGPSQSPPSRLAVQHRGFGKSLLQEAERIAFQEHGCPSLAVLSGVGAREYYRAEGYSLEGHYMVKGLQHHIA